MSSKKAVKSLYEYIDRKKQDFYEFMDWIDRSPVAKKLRREHLELLRQAIKSPGREFTSKQVSNDLDVTENTARNYLNKLAEKELLVAAKSQGGKKVFYIAPANLKFRLKLE